MWSFRSLLVEGLEQRTLLATGFTDMGSLGIASVSSGAVAWGDYDNDGRLDLLIAGDDASGNHTARLFHNNANGTFSENTAAGLPGPPCQGVLRRCSR